MSEAPKTREMPPEQRSDLQQRARYQLDRAEDSVDIAAIALRSIRDFAAMDDQLREEVFSDIGVIEHKLATLTEIISPPEPGCT